MGLDMMEILMARQQKKWAFKRAMKAEEAVPTREELLPTSRDASVVVLDNDDFE